jgi:hypothetical protein
MAFPARLRGWIFSNSEWQPMRTISSFPGEAPMGQKFAGRAVGYRFTVLYT